LALGALIILGGAVIGARAEVSNLLSDDGPHKATFITIDPPDSTGASPVDINDAGAVLGAFSDAKGSHGFVRAADGNFTIIEKPIPNAETFFPSVINASGTVAGNVDTGGVSHGFVRRRDGSTVIFDAAPTDGSGGGGTIVRGINNAGVIVGSFSLHLNGRPHGFIRAVNGAISTVDAPIVGYNPGKTIAGTTLTAINDRGWVVGSVGQAAFIRDADGRIFSFDVAGAEGTIPMSINDRNEVVGTAEVPGGDGYEKSVGVRQTFNNYICFLRNKSGYIEIFEDPVGRPRLFGCKINNRGEISGTYRDTQRTSVVFRGWLRARNGDLRVFTYPDARVTIVDFIDPNGVVGGYYLDDANKKHGFLRVP